MYKLFLISPTKHSLWVLIVSMAHLMNTTTYVFKDKKDKYLGPVVQNIVSLTSSLVVKMLTVLVSTIHRYFSSKICYMQYLMIKVLRIHN